MKFLGAVLLLPLAGLAHADWQFSAPVEVGAVKNTKLFHHLESSNRRGMTESGGRVALVWEDNREGTPRCWFSVREQAGTSFSTPKAVATGECYEPVIAGLGKGRFVLAWEENGASWTGIAGSSQVMKLSQDEAGQVTLAAADERTIFAAWAEQAGSFKRIMLARLSIVKDGLKLEYKVPLENRLPEDEQAYPAMAVNADGSVTVVWEDRRKKHTMILAAHSADGKNFASPFRLIDVPQVRTIDLGAGMGSMRPALASCGPACMAATWLDKRDFLSGYDVYAALSQDGGKSFGRNFKVQDSFGDNMAQWHASVSANQGGRVVVAWDDDRDGASDIWLSHWTGKAFSDDIAAPGASGPGVQTDPIIHLDEAGVLHLAWLERSELGGTQLKYARAVWND